MEMYFTIDQLKASGERREKKLILSFFGDGFSEIYFDCVDPMVKYYISEKNVFASLRQNVKRTQYPDDDLPYILIKTLKTKGQIVK